MIDYFTRRSVRFRLCLLIIAAAVAMAVLATALIFEARRAMEPWRIDQAQSALKSVQAVLNLEHQRELDGEISQEKAQAFALNFLRAFRFDNGEGYVAVLNDAHWNIMHPTNPSFDDVDNSNLQDSTGRYIAREAVSIGKQGGIGVNRYGFVHPVTGKYDRKTSAIYRFEPWGWTLIAGVFDHAVDQKIAAMSRHSAVIAGLAIAAFCAFAAILAASLTGPVRAITGAMRSVAHGELSTPIPHASDANEVGEMARALLVFRDVARAEVELKDELAKALAQEREMSERQRAFVSVVSHEFRTPLAVIDAAAGGLERRRDRMSAEKIDQSLSKIRGAVQRLICLVDRILATSSHAAGDGDFEAEPIDLHDLIRCVVEERRAVDGSATIELALEELPLWTVGDVRMLRSVFENLLSNAIKYGGAPPHVTIAGRMIGDVVAVSVTDNGVGIPSEEVARIGERYFRASTARGVPGTGIGVNLVREVVRRHGGDLKIESEIGVGSTFSLTLPVARGTASALAEAV